MEFVSPPAGQPPCGTLRSLVCAKESEPLVHVDANAHVQVRRAVASEFNLEPTSTAAPMGVLFGVATPA